MLVACSSMHYNQNYYYYINVILVVDTLWGSIHGIIIFFMNIKTMYAFLSSFCHQKHN